MAIRTPQEVLTFWFGELDEDGSASSETKSRWFKKDANFDREIEQGFGDTLEAATRGELDGWLESPQGTLALVVVCDQFSRNVYRGTARSFAQDERAMGYVRQLIDSGGLGELQPIHRTFAIMPLMHAEDRDLQAECVRRFEELAAATTGQVSELAGNFAFYGRKHQEIVDRFGRFPHRNEILGRESTSEEAEFLTQPGSSF
jgi:uncharacterized protein (DUF924 family)